MSETNSPSARTPKVALQLVYLRGSNVRMAADFFPAVATGPLMPLFRTGDVEISRRKTTFSNEDSSVEAHWYDFIYRFEFVYIRAEEDGPRPTKEEVEEHLVAEITADIVIQYAWQDPSDPVSSDEFNAMIGPQALMHAWPYWREYCHNTMMRMGLPVTMIPLLNIVPKTLGRNDAEDETPDGISEVSGHVPGDDETT